MSDPSDISDEEMLARLAVCDLSAAEKVHGKLMAAEEASEIAELGRTYQRLARSLRQTMALKAKLKQDAAAAAREASAPPPLGPVAVARRLRDVRAAVVRVIWDETETPEAADFTEDMLEELLTNEVLGDGFAEESLDDHIARICGELGLSPARAARWRYLPDPAAPDLRATAAEPPDPDSSA